MSQYQRCLLSFLGFAGVLVTVNPVHASGLQITEQSVTGLGRAFAGGSLPNDDASAAYFNPADMMLSKGTQAQAGMTFIGITTDVSNAGSTLRLPANLGELLTRPPGTIVPVFVTLPTSGMAYDDGGTDNVAPNGYYIMDINDRMRFGLSMTAPFAVSTSYSRNWVGRYHAIDSKLLTVDINPSIAYRINDQLSIGGGVSAQYAEAKLTQALFNPLAPANDGNAKVKGDDWGFGFNLGATYEFDPQTRVGLSYRSRVEYTLEGHRTIGNYLPGVNGKIPAKVDWTAPDWVGL
ncbi:MAG: outer membrane protein transport protein, partial [Candidatus Competibacteraceae bacterium]|nr:outer membrane protein transport protein [Candidatus Competibacteraceae bacterium]